MKLVHKTPSPQNALLPCLVQLPLVREECICADYKSLPITYDVPTHDMLSNAFSYMWFVSMQIVLCGRLALA